MEARALKVHGMVLKNSDPAYLLDCLEAVSAGRSWMDPELQARAEQLMEAFRGERPALAPRERQLIRYIRRGLRNREISKELGVTEGTVKVYLHAIFEKLGVKNRTELAIRADEYLAESFSRN
jgi:two-component system nitrate/nitrite response regulator NarL